MSPFLFLTLFFIVVLLVAILASLLRGPKTYVNHKLQRRGAVALAQRRNQRHIGRYVGPNRH